MPFILKYASNELEIETVKRHNTILQPHYVKDCRVKFEMFKDNHLLIKNMLFTGVSEIHRNYYSYKYSVENEDALPAMEIYQLKDKIFSDTLFLQCLEMLYSVIFQHKFKLDYEASSWLESHNKSNLSVIEQHVSDMADFLKLKDEDYGIASFRMIPYSTECYRQAWGPCVWYLRMFVLFCRGIWKKNKSLSMMKNFMEDVILILTCNICKYHVIQDITKMSTVHVIAGLLEMDGMLNYAKLCETILHMLVSNEIMDKSDFEPHDYINMYEESFSLFVDQCNNK